MKSASFLFAAAVCFAACKGHEKKVLVYASDKISIDASQHQITIANGDGTTHHEQELDFTTGDPVTLNVESPQGKYTVTIPDDGLYIANLKTDTVVGSRQHVGSEGGEARITQDALKHKLDSLQQLIQGQNVSDANQNYFIVPGKAVRVTTETKSKVFGPFTTIPGSFDAGSVPAIYKFYSMKEMREIIGNLDKMMTKEPAPAESVPADKKTK
ncbi:hypothetical protein [Puia dinghuensis]|uniref:Uncharacterized protein n=1 Tax=Puia dinghuensis TaxID=1792502 RepID=A0A8J2XSI6_9BACT|nr:hypothetical protein [Puia dinghuensis]GGB09503.1 hypothetical protein GCM10011511_36260 [Puia dinghuensis]